MITLIAMLAGGLGAVARFVTDGELRRRIATHWPIGTMAINLAGSLLLGVLAGAGAAHHLDSGAALVAGTGFCGGFTTFSTASLDVVRLLQERRRPTAIGVVVLTAGGAVLLASLGWGIGTRL